MKSTQSTDDLIVRIRVERDLMFVRCTWRGETFGETSSRLPAGLDRIDTSIRETSLRGETKGQRAVGGTTIDPVREFGIGVFEALVTGGVARAFRSIASVQSSDGQRTRIRFVLENVEAARIPWELAFDPSRGDFVALSDRTPVVRSATSDFKDVEPTSGRIDVLVVTADPIGGLGTEQDVTLLTDLASRHDELVRVRVLQNPDFESFESALAEPCDVFYFGGLAYGARARSTGLAEEDAIVLGADGKRWRSYPAAKLAKRLADRGRTRLAVLNALESDGAAWHLGRLLPASIGAFGDITVDECIDLCRFVCDLLRERQPIDEALTAARQRLDLRRPGARYWGRIACYLQTRSGQLFRAAQRDERDVELATNPAPVVSGDAETNRWVRLLRIHAQNLEAINARLTPSQEPSDAVKAQIAVLEGKIAEIGVKLAALASESASEGLR